MKHSGYFYKHCPLCKKDLPATDQKAERQVERRHKAAWQRRLHDDLMRGIGLKKNRYDGHWE